MASTYQGSPSNEYRITVPSDGDLRNAASVVTPFQQLANQLASVVRMQTRNWQATQFESGLNGGASSELVCVATGRVPGLTQINAAVGGVAGSAGAVVFSVDGVRWKERNLVDAQSSLPVENRKLLGIAYSSSLSLWAIVGETTGTVGLVMTGSDVRSGTWTQRTPTTTFNVTLNAVAAVDSGFVAVGNSIGASPYIVSTNNGTTWQNTTVARDAPLLDVCLKQGTTRWIAVGGDAGVPLVVYGDSVLGSVTIATLPATFDEKAIKCCWNGRVFAVISDSGDVFTSEDGVTWTLKNNAGTTVDPDLRRCIAGDPSSGALIRTFGYTAGSLAGAGLALSLDDGTTFESTADGAILSLGALDTNGDATLAAPCFFDLKYGIGKFIGCGIPETYDGATFVATSLRR
jgi:hypothetical protein